MASLTGPTTQGGEGNVPGVSGVKEAELDKDGAMETRDGEGTGGGEMEQEEEEEEEVDEATLMKQFFSEISTTDRDNEVERILWAFKLNPLEQLNLRFDVDIPKAVPKYAVGFRFVVVFGFTAVHLLHIKSVLSACSQFLRHLLFVCCKYGWFSSVVCILVILLTRILL